MSKELLLEKLEKELDGREGYAGWVTWKNDQLCVGVTAPCVLPESWGRYEVVPCLISTVEEVEDVPTLPEAEEEETPEVAEDE